MNITLPLDEMSIEEKIQAMETLWDDLCKKANSISSPSWHKNVLDERAGNLKQGKDEFVDWSKAKDSIRRKVS